MNVWRGFTLICWTLLLAAGLSLVIIYYSLSTTVLDRDKAKSWLAESSVYETLRDTVATDQVMNVLDQKYPGNKLLDRQLVSSALKETLPKADLVKRLEPTVDKVYAWLDSKQPELSISIPLADREKQFYRSSEVHLERKIAALPSCGDYRYPPEEAVLNDLCLPEYVTASEATQAAMGGLRSGGFPLGESISTDTFAGLADVQRGAKQIPTFLNYLWAGYLLAAGIAAVVAVWLLASRRVVGLIAVGVAMVIAGIVVWFAQAAIAGSLDGNLPAVAQALRDALLPKMLTKTALLAMVSIIIGLVIIALAGAWKWRQGRS